jgi:hypothetical protein
VTKAEEKKAAPTFIAKVLSLVGKTGSALASAKKKRGEKKSQTPLVEKVTPPARTSEVEEVDDWLNSILEKSAKKSAVKPVTTPAAKKAAVKKAAPKKTTTGRKR